MASRSAFDWDTQSQRIVLILPASDKILRPRWVEKVLVDGVKNWQAGKSPLPGKMTPFSVTGVKQVERQSIRFRACLTTVAPTGMKWVDFAHTPPLPIALSDGAGGQFYWVRVKFPKCMGQREMCCSATVWWESFFKASVDRMRRNRSWWCRKSESF